MHELLPRETFEHEGKTIVICESKTFVLDRVNLTNEQITRAKIDTRILTCVVLDKLNTEYDYMICVYDYDSVTKDRITEGIIWHELGHIKTPPVDVYSESACDFYAMVHCGHETVIDYLELSITEMQKLGKPINDLIKRKELIEIFVETTNYCNE